MAGLLSGMQQPQPRADTGTSTSPAAAEPMQEDDEASNVTPEEQAEYEEFVAQGLNLIYDEKVTPQVLQRIEASGNPVEGLGTALAMVVMRLEDSAEKAGRNFSGDVKLHGSSELLEGLAELAQEAGIHGYSEKEIESALYVALDTYRSSRQQQGRLPADAFAQDMQQLVQADSEGRLEELVPGITEYAGKAQNAEPPRNSSERRGDRRQPQGSPRGYEERA